jgi:hypothetical protein
LYTTRASLILQAKLSAKALIVNAWPKGTNAEPLLLASRSPLETSSRVTITATRALLSLESAI